MCVQSVDVHWVHLWNEANTIGNQRLKATCLFKISLNIRKFIHSFVASIPNLMQLRECLQLANVLRVHYLLHLTSILHSVDILIHIKEEQVLRSFILEPTSATSLQSLLIN